MNRLLAAAIAALALAPACVLPIRAEHAVTGAARPPYAGPVRVIMEGAPVPADAEELAVVSASGETRENMLPQIIQALQVEAAAVGANAVVRVRYDAGSASATGTGVAVWLR